MAIFGSKKFIFDPNQGFLEWPDKTTEQLPEPLDVMYPHYCPRCGKDAYVGFNLVQHRDTELDQICR